METLLEQLSQSPRLPQYLLRLEELMAAEKEKRREFYKIIEENKKMEFINGEIYFQSPVKLRHNLASGRLYNLMLNYVVINDLGLVGYEKLLVSLTRNDYEPDICFWKKEIADNFLPDQMQFPAPDFIVEVLSKSTEKHDREIKFEDYAAHNVTEYWLIDPVKKVIEQYVIEEEKYELKHKAQGEEIVFCQTISGFNIPVNAIFDEIENMKKLKKLMNL